MKIKHNLVLLILTVFVSSSYGQSGPIKTSIGVNISPIAGFFSESELWHKFAVHLIHDHPDSYGKKLSFSYNKSIEPYDMERELIYDTDTCRVFRSIHSRSKNFDLRFGTIHKIQERFHIGINAVLGYSKQMIYLSDYAETYNSTNDQWEIDFVKAYNYNNEPFQSSQFDYSYNTALGNSHFIRLGFKPDIIFQQPINDKISLDLIYSPELVTSFLITEDASNPFQGRYEQPDSYVRLNHFLNLYINYTL